jgi:hypothetical protein
VLLLPLGAWLAARTLYRVSGQVRGSGLSRRSIVTLALAGARWTSPGHNAYQRMQRELARDVVTIKARLAGAAQTSAGPDQRTGA